MDTFIFYILYIALFLWTLRMLPFINIDAAFWIRERLEELRRKLDKL